MDSSINIAGLSRALYRRGTHRLLGNPFLGSLTAFLTVLVLIRIAANLYMAISISNTNPNIDGVQVATAHFVFLSAYAVWVAPLASLRISLALPQLCFVNFALHGKRFRLRFVRQIAFLRPMNLASLLIMLLIIFVFSVICGNWYVVVARGLMILSATFVAIIVVTIAASRSIRTRPDIQIMEILYLLFLVSLNPDIGSFHDRVSIFLGGIYCPFSELWQAGSAVALIAVVALLVLLLIRALTAMNSLFRRQLPLSPMERWYWRFLRVRAWALLYIIIIPVFISSTISISIKRWTLVLSMLFAVASYLYFIAHCENTLRAKWRCSLSDKGNTRLVTRSVLTHVVLMAAPVVGYFLFR